MAATPRHHDRLAAAAVERLTHAVGGPARRHVIVILACVLGLNSADTATIGAIGGELETALHIGNAELGLLVSVTAGTGAIGAFGAGVLVDRVNRARLLAGAIVLWSAAALAGAFSDSYGMLLITRLVLGAVVAAAGPAVASLTGDYFAPGERARMYGFILAGELIGAGVGFLVSGEVAGLLGWRYAFVVLALPGLVLAHVVWRRLPEPARGGQGRIQPGAEHAGDAAGDERDDADDPDDREDRVAEQVRARRVRPRRAQVLREDPERLSLWQAARYVLRIRTNLWLIVASSLGYFYLTGLETFGVVFLRGHFGVGQEGATALLALILVAGIIGVVSGGRIADRLLDRGRLDARIVVGGLAYLGAGALFIPGFLTGSLALGIALYALGGFALAAPNPPLDAARLDIMPHLLWGRAEGVRTVLHNVALAGAPFIFGLVAESLGHRGGSVEGATGLAAEANPEGLRLTFLIFLAMLFLSGLLMLRARHGYPRDIATAVASDERIPRPEGD